MDDIKISISMSDIFSEMQETGFNTAEISGFIRRLTDRPEIKAQLRPDIEDAITAEMERILNISLH